MTRGEVIGVRYSVLCVVTQATRRIRKNRKQWSLDKVPGAWRGVDRLTQPEPELAYPPPHQVEQTVL